MQKLVSIGDLISEWTGRLISWLVIAMVLVTFVIVILRYFFNTGWIAMQESVLYMHATVFMLASAYSLKKNQHVRVDIFYHRMSAKAKAWVDFFGTIFLLLPVCGFIIFSSWEYVANAWDLKEGSREAGGLPWVYILKSNIILMALLLVIQGISEILRSLLLILNYQTLEKAS